MWQSERPGAAGRCGDDSEFWHRAHFAQYARDGDRGDLMRAFIDFPAELMRRVMREPRRRRAGRPDMLLGAWIRGYVAALKHVRIAFDREKR